jgi:hypothetical protein
MKLNPIYFKHTVENIDTLQHHVLHFHQLMLFIGRDMFLLSLLMSLLRNNSEIKQLTSAYVIKEKKMIWKGGFKTYQKTLHSTCMLLQQPKLLYILARKGANFVTSLGVLC